MDPAVLKQLALGGGPPFIIALVALLIAWWKRGRLGSIDAPIPPSPARPGGPLWLAPLLLGGVLIGMHPLLFGKYVLPPRAAFDWIPIGAAIAMVLGISATRVRFPWFARWAVRAVIIAACGALMSMNWLRGAWGFGTGSLWIAAFVITTLAVWWSFERVADRSRGIEGPAAALFFIGGIMQLMLLGFASLSLALVAEVLAAVLFAACVVSLVRPSFTLAFGGVHVPAVVGGMVMLQAFAAETGDVRLHPLYAGLLLLSPIASAIATFGPLGRMSGRRGTIARLAIGALPVLIAIGIAAARFTPPNADQSYEY